MARAVLNSSDLRSDGRRAGELRAVSVQSCVVSPASSADAVDGSALYTQGNTQVLCCVYGPRDAEDDASADSAEGGRVEVEVSMAAFAVSGHTRRRRVDRRLVELSLLLRQSLSPLLQLHLFPASVVRICLCVLADDGGLLPACVNAATSAVMDAGIPMTDVLLAATVALVRDSGAGLPGLIICDPSLSELQQSAASASVSVLSCGIACISGRVSFLQSAGGKLPVEAMRGLISTASVACREMHAILKAEMQRRSRTSYSNIDS
jgi:ribonuclease PH